MRRTCRPICTVVDAPPFADINTTSLIHVLLVLLIMFIITVPIATHKVAVDLPQPTPPGAAPPPVHRLTLDAAGGLGWDGAAIAADSLPARLAVMIADPAGPVLHLRAEAETPYVAFDKTLATIKRAGVTKLGLVGNERFAK